MRVLDLSEMSRVAGGIDGCEVGAGIVGGAMGIAAGSAGTTLFGPGGPYIGLLVGVTATAALKDICEDQRRKKATGGSGRQTGGKPGGSISALELDDLISEFGADLDYLV